MKNIVIVADNIRSIQNFGSILRSMECFGLNKIVACGVTPYPKIEGDSRLPHISEKQTMEIAKVSLGAEKTIEIQHMPNTTKYIEELRRKNFIIIGLEQNEKSIEMKDIKEAMNDGLNYAFILGTEVTGLNDELIELCDRIVEIRQFGHKESLNVSVAAGILFYELSNVIN